MAAIHETAYPRIKPVFTQKELIEVFKPNDTELLLLDTKTKKKSNMRYGSDSSQKLSNVLLK